MLESEVREVTSSRTKCGGVSSHSLASWEEGQEVKEEEGQEKEEAEIERIGSKEKRKERGGRMKGRRQASRKGGRGVMTSTDFIYRGCCNCYLLVRFE